MRWGEQEVDRFVLFVENFSTTISLVHQEVRYFFLRSNLQRYWEGIFRSGASKFWSSRRTQRTRKDPTIERIKNKYFDFPLSAPMGYGTVKIACNNFDEVLSLLSSERSSQI